MARTARSTVIWLARTDCGRLGIHRQHGAPAAGGLCDVSCRPPHRREPRPAPGHGRDRGVTDRRRRRAKREARRPPPTAATVLQQHLGYRAAIPTYLVASYVAMSRLHDNRHYASDVIFGAATGIMTG